MGLDLIWCQSLVDQLSLGHRAHSAESKKSAPNPRINGPKRPSPPSDASERYTVLQRKVDDLEKVHNDGKKAVRDPRLMLGSSGANTCS